MCLFFVCLFACVVCVCVCMCVDCKLRSLRYSLKNIPSRPGKEEKRGRQTKFLLIAHCQSEVIEYNEVDGPFLHVNHIKKMK